MMLYTTFHRSFGSGEDISFGSGEEGFSHIWAWQPCWACDMNRLSKFCAPTTLEATYEIWLHLAQWIQRRSRWKLLTDDDRR